MNWLRITFFAWLCISGLLAESPGWFRYPAISKDGKAIAFTYKGDLWRVPSAGGQAVQLTTHEAQECMPVWSPDGRWITFASDRNGNFDVFIMPSEGGPARRLTSHSAPEWPSAFSHDGRFVLFSAARGPSAGSRAFPHEELPQLYRVPVGGGKVQQVLTTPAESAVESPDGRLLAYQDKKGVENPWRKHHTSAIARDLWIYDQAKRTHRKLTEFPGEDRNPVLSADGRTVFFLSEAQGSFNVFKVAAAGGPPEPLTSFKTHPVRFLSAAMDGTLCFSHDGAIYTLRTGGQPQRVELSLATDRNSEDLRRVSLTSGVKEMSLRPDGKEVAFIIRGQVFAAAVEGGAARRVSQHPGLHRDISFSPDGKTLVYAAERDGQWSIFESSLVRKEDRSFHAALALNEVRVHGTGKACFQPQYSPDGKELAFIEDRQNLKVLNLATRKVRALAGPEALMSKNDGDQRFRWSPNGQWIVFNLAPTGKFQTQLGLVRADGQNGVVDLTRSGFDCMNPVWVLGGKALLYSTTRDGMRGLAAIGGSQTDWYAMFLDRVAWDRSRLSKAELTLQKEAEGKGPTPVATPEPLDLEPRWDRTTRLTLQSARMGDAVLSADGETLYYLARFERGLNLWSTQVRTKETRMLTPLDASAATLTWDREQKTLLLLADGMIAKVDPGTGRKDPIPVSCELWLNPAAERMAMFEHATRRITETFYDRSFRGLDWQGLCKAYAKHVPHTGSSFELAELLSELLGELNVSHSGGYLRAKEGDVDLTASLGFLADETHQGSGIRVAEVLRNGPLDKADLTAGPGTVIEAIDGEAIPADRDWVGLLNRKAGKRVLVQLKNGEQRSEAVVRPIPVAEETLLLYERWVRRNRDEVETLSGGKLGYVHVRNGFDRPFRNIIEEVIGHRDGRVGVIVDTRFNPGGALTSDLITFLTGRRMFHSDAAGRNVGWEPGARWTGASVLLTNEGAYSDGHCLSCAFQSQGVGKIVGMPVPGTCIWSISELLQDETIICGAPTVGMKDTSGRLLEGIQVEPDVRVPNPYGEVAAGRDAQLAAAVQVLLAETSVSGKGR